MSSDATVHLIGHIGEPKFQQVGEHLVARFGLATTRKRKGSEVTTWWNCTVWRKDAEFVQRYVKKGNLLAVIGDAYEEEYEGKKSMKVEARKVMNLSPRASADEDTRELPPTQAAAVAREKAQRVGPSTPADDDLQPPF